MSELNLSNVSCAGTGGKNCKCGHCQHMKKMSEFNLSKSRKEDNWKPNYSEDDVKEFIKRDGDIIQEFIEGKISCAGMWLKRDNLAGDKLI